MFRLWRGKPSITLIRCKAGGRWQLEEILAWCPQIFFEPLARHSTLTSVDLLGSCRGVPALCVYLYLSMHNILFDITYSRYSWRLCVQASSTVISFAVTENERRPLRCSFIFLSYFTSPCCASREAIACPVKRGVTIEWWKARNCDWK